MTLISDWTSPIGHFHWIRSERFRVYNFIKFRSFCFCFKASTSPRRWILTTARNRLTAWTGGAVEDLVMVNRSFDESKIHFKPSHNDDEVSTLSFRSLGSRRFFSAKKSIFWSLHINLKTSTPCQPQDVWHCEGQRRWYRNSQRRHKEWHLRWTIFSRVFLLAFHINFCFHRDHYVVVINLKKIDLKSPIFRNYQQFLFVTYFFKKISKYPPYL